MFSLVSIPVLAFYIFTLAVFSPERLVLKVLRSAIKWYGSVIIRILGFPLVRIKYKDFNFADTSGPHLFICNHRSASDPFLMAVLPGEIIQVANIWPLRLPVLGAIAKLGGYLSIREIPFDEFMAKCKKLLAEGVSIAVFPEGTRSHGYQMGQFHSAAFRLALETHKPIVPVCISGNEKVFPLRSLFLRPGCIRIHAMPELKWEDYKENNPFILKNRVRQILLKELENMDRR